MLGDAVTAAGSRHAPGRTGTDPVFTTGWEVITDCTFLHLYHPALNIHLDIQVRTGSLALQCSTHLHFSHGM
jgi:hypothetical protein